MAKQALAKASQNVSKLPNASLLNETLNKEFDVLMSKMSDYYELKKEVLESKKSDLAKKYEHSVLKVRYQQMKQDFKAQRRSWELLVARYA